MTPKRITKAYLNRRIKAAQEKIAAEIKAFAGHGKFAAGLASEGFAGGYSQALSDIQLLINGVEPGDTRGYWNEP